MLSLVTALTQCSFAGPAFVVSVFSQETDMLSPHWPRALMSSLCWFSAPLLVQFSQRIAICCFYCPPDMLSLWSPGSKRGAVSYLTGDRYVVSALVQASP